MLGSIDVNKKRLPVDVAGLPVIEAKVKYTIAPGKKGPSLEGPVFDREGNYYCCHTAPNDTTVKKITEDGTISDWYHADTGMVVGLCFHKDGRCFATDMIEGSIRILSKEGELLDKVFLTDEGRHLKTDCMVFTEEGDLLVTDLSGTTYDPIGGIYKLNAGDNYRSYGVYFTGMPSPNGICYSPNHDALWVATSADNCLNRLQLEADGSVMFKQYTPMKVYKNMGKPNVDTLCIDDNGFIYLAIMFGGRVLVLDREGIPVANVLVPGYEEGKLLYTPNLAIHPNRPEAYMVASDGERAVVLSFETTAPSQRLFSLK